jgi:hypothetical protein
MEITSQSHLLISATKPKLVASATKVSFSTYKQGAERKMKTISEATPQEILKRIDELDREFWKVTPAQRPFVAEAISILVQAHQKKVSK